MSKAHLRWLGALHMGLDVRRLRRWLGVASVVLIVLLISASILELGVWTRTEVVHGPYHSEGGSSRAYIVRVGRDIPFRAFFRPQGERPGSELQSDLQMSVNGEIWGPAFAPHDVIRRGESRRFSHWRDSLFFTLPSAVANDENTVLTLKYSVGLRGKYLFALVASTALVSLLWVRTASVDLVGNAARWRSLLTLVFLGTSWLVIAACGIYGATIVYGIYAGYGLPTATIFKVIPVGRYLATLELTAPLAIIVFAASGAALAWLAVLKIVPRMPLRRMEIKLARVWSLWSLAVIAALFVFSISAGGWAGHVRITDVNYLSLAGLVPHSDARAYFTDAFHQAYWGQWDILGSRRPIAQAFRQILVFIAQYSYVATLLVQACLLAVVTHACAKSISRWRGIWAGIAFVGFVYLLARPFLQTTLTESLGLIWTLFSLIFLIEALRLQSVQHAFIALIGLTFALLTRMGSLFSIPFLIIWIAVAYAGTPATRVRLFALACGAVLAVGALNALLGHLYGSASVIIGGNFAWTVCGLSLGGDWSSCMKAYPAEYNHLPSERAQVFFLLLRAWDNFLQDPTILIHKLGSNLVRFVTGLPTFLLSGYGFPTPPRMVGYLAALALVPGLFFVLRWRSSFAERMLWILLAVSLPLSAAVVMIDDGWRVLSATHPLVACFVALGFSAPGVLTLRHGPVQFRWQSGAALIAIIAALFLTVPALSHILGRSEIAAHSGIASAAANEHVVPGGRRITGFVVIPDGTTAPNSIPSIPLTEFNKLVEYTRIEDEFGPFLQEVVHRLPFAFIVAGRLDDANQSNIYIAPPAVLEQGKVWAWRFTLRQWSPWEKPWVTLREAVSVQRLP